MSQRLSLAALVLLVVPTATGFAHIFGSRVVVVILGPVTVDLVIVLTISHNRSSLLSRGVGGRGAHPGPDHGIGWCPAGRREPGIGGCRSTGGQPVSSVGHTD